MKTLMLLHGALRGSGAGLAIAAMAWPLPALAQRSDGPAVLRPVYHQWTTYFNPRFAYEVPVPPGMRAQSDPRKGSSCRFVSDDGFMVLKVWGNTLASGPRDPLEGAWREAVNLRGRRIDFQRRTPQAFVLAGVMADGAEFFEKVILGKGATAGFNIAYPPSMARRMSGLVQEIEQGFGWNPQAMPERSQSGVPSQGPVDLTPPPSPSSPAGPSGAPENVPDPSLEKTNPPDQPAPSPVKPTPPAKREDLPYGIVIPGKQGYVYSPFTGSKQEVDVTGIPTGTKVKCPYTGKVFRVP